MNYGIILFNGECIDEYPDLSSAKESLKNGSYRQYCDVHPDDVYIAFWNGDFWKRI